MHLQDSDAWPTEGRDMTTVWRTAPAIALRREGVPNEAVAHRVRCIEWLVQGRTVSSMVSGGSIR